MKTGGSDVKFHTEAIGKKWPALVLDTITFTDPAPKAIVSERQEAWKGISNLGEFQAFIDAVVKEEDAFLKAEGVDASNINETFGIRNERRQALVREMLDGLRDTGLSVEDRTNAKGADYRHVHQARSQSGLRYESGKPHELLALLEQLR